MKNIGEVRGIGGDPWDQLATPNVSGNFYLQSAAPPGGTTYTAQTLGI